MNKRLSLMLIHPNFSTGGAETQITQLLSSLSRAYDLHVVIFNDIQHRILDLSSTHSDVTFHNLEKQPGPLQLPTFLWKLLRLVKKIDPAVIMSFLHHVNLLSLAIGRITGKKTIIWGLRTSNFLPREFGLKGDLVDKANIKFSSYVDVLISNNRSGLKQFQNRGALPKMSVFIPNGIDTDKYSPSETYRRQSRQEIGVDENTTVVGIVARVVPWKGYEVFLKAAAMVAQQKSNTVFVCIGNGNPEFEQHCAELVSQHGLESVVKWLGDRLDIPIILNGIDIFTLTSTSGEGFSNALCEAMATARYVISTDVGDSKEIIGDTGVVIEPNNSIALAEAVISAVDDITGRKLMGQLARQRILTSYSIAQCSKHYEQIIGRVSLAEDS